VRTSRVTGSSVIVPRARSAAEAVSGVALYLEKVVLPPPALRTLADAALGMVASPLVPLAPLDGARLGTVRPLAGAVLLGAVLLLFHGVVK